MRRFKRFTEAEDQQITRMHGLGMGNRAIGRELDRCHSSIKSRVKLLALGKITHKPLADAGPAELGKTDDKSIREATHKLWVAVARAIANGDHLPAAQRLAA